MGNRAYFYLSQHRAQKLDLVFESNNHLPFFWILLLDVDLFASHREAFAKVFDGEDLGQDSTFISLSKEGIETNVHTAMAFLERCYPQLVPKFIAFGKYAQSLTEKGNISLDIIQILEFYPTLDNFFDSIVGVLKKVENQDRLDAREESNYLDNDHMAYLVGFDDYSSVEDKFFDLSKSKHADETSTKNQKSFAFDQRKSSGYERMKKIAKEIVLAGVFGISLCVYAVFSFMEGGILLGVISLVFGLLGLLFTYVNMEAEFFGKSKK